MQEIFAVYKTKNEKQSQEKLSKDLKKAQSYMKDVIMAGVIKPKLSREKDCEGAIFVDDILKDWTLTQSLCSEILTHTYGKKK